MITPDYHGGSIVNLINSIVVAGGGKAVYDELDDLPASTVNDYDNVVIFLVDGLGSSHLEHHHPDAFLTEQMTSTMTSVFPSATGAAIPTFNTGIAPQQHGLTGWYQWVRDVGAVVKSLPFTTRYEDLPFSAATVHDIFDHETVYDKVSYDCHVVTVPELADTPYTTAHASGAAIHAADDIDAMCDTVASLTNGDTYIYAYWPDVDSLMHDLGTTHDDVHAAVQRVDDALSSLAERLNDTLLIVTADHGLIDVETKLYVNDHPELRNTLRIPLCGEPRAAYAYVKPGREAAFTNQVQDALGGACEVLPSTQLVDDEYFGMGKPSAELINRIGDYVILPNESHVIYDLLPEEEAVHTGFHGGLTEEEMLVPLIVYSS